MNLTYYVSFYFFSRNIVKAITLCLSIYFSHMEWSLLNIKPRWFYSYLKPMLLEIHMSWSDILWLPLQMHLDKQNTSFWFAIINLLKEELCCLVCTHIIHLCYIYNSYVLFNTKCKVNDSVQPSIYRIPFLMILPINLSSTLSRKNIIEAYTVDQSKINNHKYHWKRLLHNYYQ